MALFVKQQNEEKTELQSRIEAELREKAKKRAIAADLPDGVDDSQYVVGTKKTTTLAWAWILIIIATIGIVIWLTVLGLAR